jgi:hypothetical protein
MKPRLLNGPLTSAVLIFAGPGHTEDPGAMEAREYAGVGARRE